MLSDGIVSFWSAFDQKDATVHPLAAALLRHTRARLHAVLALARAGLNDCLCGGAAQ